MSLTITKNTSNTIVVTLYEKTTLEAPFYLFEFINTVTGTKSYCIPAELSTEIQAYNKFTIIEKTSPDPRNGEVLLAIGDYIYNVYEQEQEFNYDPNGLTAVETGVASCIDATTNVNKQYTGGSLTNVVYNG